jgi:hypothetical protein
MNIYALDPFNYNLRGLGEENCQVLLDNVAIYTRLSKKTDKSKSTRENAAKIAAENQVKYNACLEGKATTAVQTLLQQQGVIPATVVTQVTPTVVVPTGSSTSLAVPTTPVGSIPVTTDLPVAGESWFAANKILLIGGGVVAVGLIAYLMLRKKD